MKINKIVKSLAGSPSSSPASVITGRGGGAAPVNWQSRISASGDDGWWDAAMIFVNSTTTNQVGFSGLSYVNENSFFRFQSVTVPNASVITAATLTLVVGANATATFNMSIKGEDVDDSSQYGSRAAAAGATETTAGVTWTGSSGWATSDVEESPDIKTIIQEIVNRSGWASGNDLTLRLKYAGAGSGGENYKFKTYNDSAGVSALLSITY